MNLEILNKVALHRMVQDYLIEGENKLDKIKIIGTLMPNSSLKERLELLQFAESQLTLYYKNNYLTTGERLTPEIIKGLTVLGIALIEIIE